MRTRRGVSPRANEDLADFRPISRTGYIRVAPVMAIPEVLRQLDVDPTSVLDAAGLHRDTFEHADNRISIREIGRLFDLCARMTGREHFGVLVGMRFSCWRFSRELSGKVLARVEIPGRHLNKLRPLTPPPGLSRGHLPRWAACSWGHWG